MSTGDFRERARREAERYGADPWVFVRELLQNARDAGAGVVVLTAQRRDGRDVVTCRDDGCGMSLEHAQRFLFTLYRSSKRPGGGAAGRFGVGFWSILRFDPDTITVRSRSANGDGWEVVLDAALEATTPARCVMFQGTEVVLERAAEGSHPLPMVLDAARRDARYLRARDDGRAGLEVTVNGRPVNQELALPAPSLTFRRPGLRGVVSLGGEARVDVLAHGLRVRSAPFLDELLLDEGAPPAVELADGLLPRVVLDSDRLEVLLARGDIGDSAALRRAVTVARSALRRLVRRELDRAAPLHGPRRWLERALEVRPRGRTASLVGAVLAGAVLGVALAMAVAGRGAPRVSPAGVAPAPVVGTSRAVGADHPLLYRDLASAYGGPTVDEMDDHRTLALTYRPASASPWLAALRLEGTGEGTGTNALLLGPYEGAPCREGCLDVELLLDAAPGPLHLPVPTGQAVDPTSVRLDGAPVDIQESAAGEPVLVLAERRRGALRYRCGPAPASAPAIAATWPTLPAGLAADAVRLQRLPPSARVDAAVRLVASRIRYDRSPEVAARHRAAIAAGAGALERALVIGAGDCDVQNFVLAAVLDATGLESRLAVGFVGREGRAVGGAHAWAEVLYDGRWRVADASLVTPGGGAAATAGSASSPAAAASALQRSDAAASATSRLPRGAWALAAAAVGLLGLTALALRRRRRAVVDERAVSSSDPRDLVRLLRAALLRPGAWSRVEAVYARPLVPTLRGRRTSLRRTVELARRGRLFRATRDGELVRRLAARRGAVVDAGSPEGRAVAELLGAIDLDRWQEVVEKGSRDEVVRRMEEALRRAGLEVHLLVVDEAPEPVAVMDGHPFGFGRRSHLVAVDAGSRVWSVVTAAADRREWAALLLADEIVERARGVGDRGVRVRALLARRALRGAPA